MTVMSADDPAIMFLNFLLAVYKEYLLICEAPDEKLKINKWTLQISH